MWLDYGVTLFWLVNIWGGEIIRGRKDNQKDIIKNEVKREITYSGLGLIFIHLLFYISFLWKNFSLHYTNNINLHYKYIKKSIKNV